MQRKAGLSVEIRYCSCSLKRKQDLYPCYFKKKMLARQAFMEKRLSRDLGLKLPLGLERFKIKQEHSHV